MRISRLRVDGGLGIGTCMCRLGVVLPLLLLLAVSALPAAEVPQKTTHMVAVRDGTKLATDVYLPQGAKGPWPAILITTPYGKDQFGQLAEPAQGHGYALVAQDMRGRFDSEGTDALVFH